MTERVNNFPPLPKLLRIKPCFYQDIDEEIPQPYCQIVRRVYKLWILYSITLCVNLVSCIAWTAGGGSAVNIGLGLLWLILFSPCSYTCCGWIATVLFFSTNVGSAVIMLFSALLFTIDTVLMGLVLIRIHRLYRGGGGSLQRAQEEWSTGVWKSAPVKEAGFNAVVESGSSLPQYPASVPNYPENRPW
ncbi:Secretory carrier-associated membrane protein 4 [Bagarius yarrelli]|uniref:Secretory carrier-associated membrane protein n=1 Tax=Bagarius yarrelli TaxID=175774 RepID=A0A556TRZ7_BAGYA|nr:Secretory carrier-associated membrane protein 4 [Bagarius yarrelli]